MNETLRSLVGDALERSSIAASLRGLKGAGGPSRLFGGGVRGLSAPEIAELESRGNRSSDWSRVLVAEGFSPAFVAGSVFAGDCVIGALRGEAAPLGEGPALPCGIYDSTIADSEIGNGCLVSRAALVSNYVIREGAVVFDVGALSASRRCFFGNGREIAIGIETGGREVLSYAEITIPVAAAVATRRGDRAFQEAYREFVKSYADACGATFGVVERGAVVRRAPAVEDAYVGEGAVIDGAVLVQNCTLLSSPEERAIVSHGAYVRNSCLQYGCEATSMAIVDDAVLTEHSHVERHGKVTQSIIGPNTGVAEGEITASLVGPFVGFHHQAMLIAAVWPEGKGNVAYGANIGSNHTSKAPDQEIRCGEGLFFGLGVNVKFPSDFTEAPYSLIATAVDTLPQRIEFPFSLVNRPARTHEGVPLAYNEIFPGWVLADDLYLVLRNEGKYKKRNKAKRTAFAFDVFRRDIVEKMVAARDRLANAAPREVYTDADVPGLGKNFMLESSRRRGIETYDFFIEYFALQGLAARAATLAGAGEKERIATIYTDAAEDPEWEYRRGLIASRGWVGRRVSENLERLALMHERVARDTERSKERDDIRGKRIIPDYAEANTLAPDDAFVKETWERSKRLGAEVRALASTLGA